MIADPLTLTALIAATTAGALWLDYRFAPLSKLGAPLIAIALGALLSNTGVVSVESPVYDTVLGPLTFLAIAWLLLAVDLADVRRVGPRMMKAFGLALTGTTIGAFVGAALFSGTFASETWKLAGTLTGTYTGGSLNFVAVGRSVGLDSTLFAGATAADNVTTALWLGATLTIPLWMAALYPTAPTSDAITPADAVHRHTHHPLFVPTTLSGLQIATLVATGAVLVVAASALGARTPGIPTVVWLTTLALLVGNATPLRGAPGALQLGNLALLAFFVVIGIFSRIADIFRVGVEVFFFTLVIVAVHGAIVFGIGRLAGLDASTLSVASQAAIGGPSTALALAVTRGWRHLVLPGVIVGLLGYAVGTYLGLAVGWAVRNLWL